MVLINNPEYAKKARSLRNLCFDSDRRFCHTELGYNFRLTNLQAAIGLAQLEKVDELVQKKRWIGKMYNELLQDVPGLALPVEQSWAKNVYWMYGVVLDGSVGINAQELSKRLLDLGIQTRPFFFPLHLQPAFKRYPWFKQQMLPTSELLCEYGLYLPTGLTLKERDIKEVCQSLKQALAVKSSMLVVHSSSINYEHRIQNDEKSRK
jgi:perosamine synthetase